MGGNHSTVLSAVLKSLKRRKVVSHASFSIHRDRIFTIFRVNSARKLRLSVSVSLDRDLRISSTGNVLGSHGGSNVIDTFRQCWRFIANKNGYPVRASTPRIEPLSIWFLLWKKDRQVPLKSSSTAVLSQPSAILPFRLDKRPVASQGPLNCTRILFYVASSQDPGQIRCSSFCQPFLDGTCIGQLSAHSSRVELSISFADTCDISRCRSAIPEITPTIVQTKSNI